jgi:hypothetical protein
MPRCEILAGAANWALLVKSFNRLLEVSITISKPKLALLSPATKP